jgi:hypothetical protein
MVDAALEREGRHSIPLRRFLFFCNGGLCDVREPVPSTTRLARIALACDKLRGQPQLRVF